MAKSLFELDGEFEEGCPFTDAAPPVAEKPKRGRRKPGVAAVEIENVGPIQEVSIPVQAGSVVVLRGSNGVGKTTAIESIKAAVNGKSDAKLTPTDGSEREGGSIEFNGVLMRVGARLSKKGTAIESFVIVEGGDAMDTFCDPGIQDPHSADEHRLRAMLTMSGLKITRERLEGFLGDEICDAFLVAHRGVLDKPMVVLVKLLQKWLQAQAREMESDADVIRGQIEAIGKIPEDIDCRKSPAELQLTATARGEHLSRLRGQKKAADDAKAMLESESTVMDVESLTNELEQSVNRARELQAQLDAEREKIAGLRSRISSGKEQLARIQRMRDAIASSVTDDDIENAERLYNEVVELRDRAVLASRQNAENSEKRTRLEKARKSLERVTVLGERIRSMSDSAIGLLRDAIAKFEGWEVSKDLRLMCHHAKRGMIPIAEHSPGERIQQAIRLMLPTFKTSEDEVPICVIPQKLFEQLDIDGQEDLVRLAKENGLFIVAAQCRKSKSEPSELTVDVLA